ncbi:MAG: hypothetical protein NVSMB19_06780 [Vulcanimicrobiaceae bacterium]
MHVKRLTLFPRPLDRDAFHHGYETTYIEAAERLPAMLRWRCTIPLGDDAARPYHVIGELYFRDRAALEAALESEAGRAFLRAETALSTGGAPQHAIAIEHEAEPGTGQRGTHEH